MLPFISFVLMWLGCLNWFFISAFQYDFVAGFFGTQSSLFSRIVYFIIGMAAFYFLFFVLKNKGKISLFQNPFKKRKNKEIQVAVPVEKVSAPQTDEAEINPTETFAIAQPTKPNSFSLEPKAQSGYKDFDVTKYDN